MYIKITLKSTIKKNQSKNTFKICENISLGSRVITRIFGCFVVSRV